MGVFLLLLTLVCTLAFPRSGDAQASQGNANQTLAITHVTVIDATGSPAQPDMTVLIAGGRIAEIGRAAEIAVPARAQVVDATGKFLIPGLVDMHVHTSWDAYFIRPLMLANGITSVRDMYSYDFDAIKEHRGETAGGDLTGPRIVAAGPIVDGPNSPWANAITVATAAEARRAVDSIRDRGYDFVKMYSSLNRESYFAIANEAKKIGIPFAGHVPGVVSDSEASEAGQRSIEHLLGLSLACSSREAELRQSPIGPAGSPRGYYGEQQAELDSYSDEKAAELFAQFKKNGTWQVPTLVVMRNAALVADPAYARSLRGSSRLAYVPYSLGAMWALGLRFPPKLTPEELATSKRYFQWELRVVGEMQKAGVGILAGTDTPNPYVYPGFGLHDELALLVEAGLTPMEALQAATRNPAKYLGVQDFAGTVEKGKIADLDLLDKNPLEDTRNTQSVNAVVLGGRFIPRAALDKLLNTARSNLWRANPAAITLVRVGLHLMRKAILGVAAVLMMLFAGMFTLLRYRQNRRNKKRMAR